MADQEIQEIERTIPFGVPAQENGMAWRVLQWIGADGALVPPYWSAARDIYLRNLYARSDYLKIAVATFVQKAYAVPLSIRARDMAVRSHVDLAAAIYEDVMRYSGFLKGFLHEFSKFTVDYLTQDNGAFMLVMADGAADRPVVGQVRGLMHLDSQRCQRTGRPDFPVIFLHPVDGKRYALHYTRCLFMSSMPSPNADLFDVGLCAVSRCLDAVQDTLDMTQYTSEKLGGRPPKQILYAKQGATLPQLSSAISSANVKMDGMGLTRFARTMIMAPAERSNNPLELDVIDLSNAPDGFNRPEATMMDVAVIASAFGLDARDLAHSFGMAGQTKSDAEVMDRKTKDKGVAVFLDDFAEQLEQKVLPVSIEAWFDYVDDTQDEQAATIKKTRSEARASDIASGVITVRVAREQMLEDEEIDDEQFEALELAEGRLPDGMDVLMLFQSEDVELQRILDLGVDNPLDTSANDAGAMSAAIDAARLLAWDRHETAPNAKLKRKMRQALAALDKLGALYGSDTSAEVTPVDEPVEEDEPIEEDEPVETEAADQPDAAVPPAAATKAADTIAPPKGGNFPSVPTEEALAAEAEADADAAVASWDAANPKYAGLIDARVKKKSLDEIELKASDRFTYNPQTHRYRDTSTGRFVSEATVRQQLAQYEGARKEIGTQLASQLSSGGTAKEWLLQMRQELKLTYTAEYMLGRGGRSAMTAADWGKLGSMLRTQYTFLDAFAREVAAGNLSEARIAARARMYFDSATQAYERARTSARGMPDLPAYPGDGSTECKSNCKCSWTIEETKTAWRCRWTLGPTEHCDTCTTRSAQWSPLIVPKQ